MLPDSSHDADAPSTPPRGSSPPASAPPRSLPYRVLTFLLPLDALRTVLGLDARPRRMRPRSSMPSSSPPSPSLLPSRPPPPSTPPRTSRLRRIGSELFDFSGGGADPSITGDRSGLFEDLRTLLEQGIHATFEAVRRAVRCVTFTRGRYEGRAHAKRSNARPRNRRLIRRKSDPALRLTARDHDRDDDGKGQPTSDSQEDSDREGERERRRRDEAGPSSPGDIWDDSMGMLSPENRRSSGGTSTSAAPAPAVSWRRSLQLRAFGRSRSTAVLHGKKGLREEMEGLETPTGSRVRSASFTSLFFLPLPSFRTS